MGGVLSPVPQDCTSLAHDATSNDNTFSTVVVYVDEILICSTSSEWITTFKSALATKFYIKDLGPCKWLLGMTIERNIPKHTLTIHQGTYIRELLRRFGMADCKHATTPTSANDTRESPLMEATDSTHYRSVVGALLYPSVATRPYITETVSRLCRFMSNPTVAHMEDAKTCLRYLQRTANRGINFGGEELRLHGFNDANYPTTYPSGSRATSGYVFCLYGGAVIRLGIK
jgi:histone deacetylase 1/2